MTLDILVIDDDPFVAKIVALCLRSLSAVAVRATADGRGRIVRLSTSR